MLYILTWGGIAKYLKYLHDSFQTFTHIPGLLVMELCQFVTTYLTRNKSYCQKTGRQEEPSVHYIRLKFVFVTH